MPGQRIDFMGAAFGPEIANILNGDFSQESRRPVVNFEEDLMEVNSFFLFGEFLVNEGVITYDQLGQALMEQIHGNFSENRIIVEPTTRKRIGEVMVQMGILNAKEVEIQLERYKNAISKDA